MVKEVEIEFKQLVTDKQFQELVNHFTIDQDTFVEQHNHYLDTKEFLLKEKKCSVRIREKAETFTLTLKVPKENAVEETHQTLSKEDAESVFNQQFTPTVEMIGALSEFHVTLNDLYHFGTLSTERAYIPFQDGVLFFDKSNYLGETDYELEYEASDYQRGKEVFENLLKQFNIIQTPTDTKVKRFFKKKFPTL
ncbi:CYTH domain-containing protein [Mangrovibacillus cuniculi]|uniref:CYTH domain-containing protein n=1 Tax=Mangrovibacillus cuniculi TaxID=2593652 RepID=A0A7S8HEP7_9BACI|nr:CYTH domain-containing protein [Mangrovibacillus cuniculi]QPC46084.1 CYTH domain-containing protein [Mangrovibacillus cuniculi]